MDPNPACFQLITDWALFALINPSEAVKYPLASGMGNGIQMASNSITPTISRGAGNIFIDDFEDTCSRTFSLASTGELINHWKLEQTQGARTFFHY